MRPRTAMGFPSKSRRALDVGQLHPRFTGQPN